METKYEGMPRQFVWIICLLVGLLLLTIAVALDEELKRHEEVKPQAILSSECKLAAAEAGVAEFYLNSKTGKTDWKWKSCYTSSGTLQWNGNSFIQGN
jgi:hypothetical protein